MASINFRKEKFLFRKGYKIVIGIDEAGRGPLAGPITAAALAVIGPISNFQLRKSDLPKINNIRRSDFQKLKDSKKLTPKRREEFYKILTRHPRIRWAAASVGPKTIDKINVAKAANLAAGRAFKKLIAKIYPFGTSREARQSTKIPGRPSWNFSNGSARSRSKIFVLLDGSLFPKILQPEADPRPTASLAKAGVAPQAENPKFYILNSQTVIKGDEKIWSIAAASVIAKVTRDRKMRRLAKKLPEYGLEIHKGYGTKLHYQKLKKHGPSEIHRKTFCN